MIKLTKPESVGISSERLANIGDSMSCLLYTSDAADE